MQKERYDKFGFTLAPKSLISSKKKIRFMYRENPENNADSGWRFFSGDETDEYVNNPENIGLYDIKTIMSIDPDIEPYLNSPYGSAFEREMSDQAFSRAKDFFE